MTQEPKRKKRPAVDEGASYTKEVMAEVKQLRTGMEPSWSAERLAAEMGAVGIPWTRDTVVNLENGRRKRLAAHELLALAYVLEVGNPADLIVPRAREPLVLLFPGLLVARSAARAWIEGQTGALRQALAVPAAGEPDNLAALLGDVPEATRQQVIAMVRSAAIGRPLFQQPTNWDGEQPVKWDGEDDGEG